MCARCGNGPDDSPLLGEKELGLPEGKTPLPLCTVCHTANKAPVLVNRADQATKELGRKEKKADAKKAVVAEKAAPKPRPAKGARAKAAAASASASAPKPHETRARPPPTERVVGAKVTRPPHVGSSSPPAKNKALRHGGLRAFFQPQETASAAGSPSASDPEPGGTAD